jgi:DNA invertase Pin-like site-specific DNA recombinase
MKVALYSRVSTDEQNSDNQKLALEKWAYGFSHAFEYFEETASTRKERPVKYALLKRLRDHEFDAVVVWKLDRWARDTKELLFEVDELVNKRVGFISLTESIDLTTASGRMMFGMWSVLAQFERDRLLERIRLGIDRAKKEGKHCGRPMGSKDKDPRRKSGYWARWSKKE